MVNFPIFDRLRIEDYGLFPGTQGEEQGLNIEFQPGLTLVIGANGLGKTTLVSIIYRLLTGPFDIPGLSGRSGLGNQRLVTTLLSAANRKVFARRVVNGARNAKARLEFRLGEHEIIVERRLSDLSLLFFSVDGDILAVNEQENFQAEILRLTGVWSFGDWVLLLRHLVFYFEDRRALVWDASAQRQILRFLFLPVATAQKWAEDERAILELDSRMRNLRATVTREERELVDNEIKIETGVDVRQELQTLGKLQSIDEEQRELLEGEVVELEASRQQARLRLLKAEQEYEARFRELERSKLMAISARFPDRSETARYILAHLMTEEICLVCGHAAPSAADDYRSRIEDQKCVVCNTDLTADGAMVPETRIADMRVGRAADELAGVEEDLEAARTELQEAEQIFDDHVNEIQKLNSELAERSHKMDSLIRRLPKAEAEIHRQRSELATMRSRVEELRSTLDAKRQEFSVFVEKINRELATCSEDVKAAFESFAEDFLLEMCRLVWAPQKARVGETGELIDFPAFALEMTGSDFPSPVPRTGPEQVSESQRDFVDLSFRMALMTVAGTSAMGSLIIDAPESSLDAVFVSRAAAVLARFSEPNRNNRLVVTSNLVEGGLIPTLLRRAVEPTEREGRIIDLLELAAPTAAVRHLRGEYDELRKALTLNNSSLDK